MEQGGDRCNRCRNLLQSNAGGRAVRAGGGEIISTLQHVTRTSNEQSQGASVCAGIIDFAFARTKSDGPLLAHTTCGENNDKCTTTTY